MTDTRDCMGPELLPGLPELETPEQHTARVLVELDAWLRAHPQHEFIVYAITGPRILARVGMPMFPGPDALVTDATLIGALANLLEAIRAIDT